MVWRDYGGADKIEILWEPASLRAGAGEPCPLRCHHHPPNDAQAPQATRGPSPTLEVIIQLKASPDSPSHPERAAPAEIRREI